MPVLGGGADAGRVHVVFGGEGTGKTTLLSAIATTRPGHAVLPLGGSEAGAGVETEWILRAEEPNRPHLLVVTSPAFVRDGEEADQALARRREQALFDRRAQLDGGFAFASFSGARWFSRMPTLLTSPERTILQPDARLTPVFDDPTKADLTRDAKQMLAYAVIGRALTGDEEERELHLLEAAVRHVVDTVLEPFEAVFAGIGPRTLEPMFRTADGSRVTFDGLPRGARHLVAIGALTLRALLAATRRSPGDPRGLEGVVAVDDIETQQRRETLLAVPGLLRRALPNVQWIVTTASPELATSCAAEELVVLSRMTDGAMGVLEHLLQ